MHKSHNVSVYHIVLPVKYSKVVFNKKVEAEIVSICKEIEGCYEVHFLEIGCKYQKYYGKRSLQMLSPDKETIVGWIILDERLFRKHRKPS